MPKQDFSHVDTWVFDLDDTLYPPHTRLFDQIEQRMVRFVMDPEEFLETVHDIDMGALTPDADLRARITALPGRKIIYTNGTAPYATRVASARGLDGIFDAIYGVEHAGYLPKPEHAAFAAVFAADGLDQGRAAMFEDDPRNLSAPHAMGMRTVHVAPTPLSATHIHHHTDDLSGFLAKLI